MMASKETFKTGYDRVVPSVIGATSRFKGIKSYCFLREVMREKLSPAQMQELTNLFGKGAKPKKAAQMTGIDYGRVCFARTAYLAKKRGYTNYTDYRKDLAKRKGYKTLWRYQENLQRQRLEQADNINTVVALLLEGSASAEEMVGRIREQYGVQMKPYKIREIIDENDPLGILFALDKKTGRYAATEELRELSQKQAKP